MQESIKLKLSEEQQELLKQDPNQISAVINEVIPVFSDQIGYMLQAYHPRQKVSEVKVIAGSASSLDNATVSLKISYVIEEFSACSAVDIEDKASMPVSIATDKENGELTLTGEYWPSLD